MAAAVALAGIGSPAPGQPPESFEPVRLPFWSESSATSLLNREAVRIVLTHRYQEIAVEEVEQAVGDGDAGWRTFGLDGISIARFFELREEREDGSAKIRRLELALVDRAGMGYELYVEGVAIDGEALSANEHREEILGGASRWVNEFELARPGATSDRYFVYQLSHVQSDRAVALLKTLGYWVVEYRLDPSGGGDPPFDSIFTSAVTRGQKPRPLVINLIDSQATSLVNAREGKAGGGGAGDVLDLGGQPLSQMTTGGPQQRLLIVWQDARELGALIDLLNNHIDQPAKQILIEALVIELDQDTLRDIGVSFEGSDDGRSFAFPAEPTGGLLFSITRPAASSALEFTAAIEALVDDEEARVLSRPSVLVLDGRQARIQVGDKLPYTDEITTGSGGQVIASTGYIPVGIVLNLRPRASADNAEVTMQVETLISSARSSELQGQLLIGPEIQSREVQTLVRVANNTPFVIGGLISEVSQDVRTGVPGLSKIPLLGRLFRRDTTIMENKEVIVVITPHVIEPEDRSFSYGPKAADDFDSFGHALFRNFYRVRRTDIFDLDFIRDSEFYNCLAFSTLREARDAVGEIEPRAGTQPRGSCPRYEPPEDLESLLLKVEERARADDQFNPSDSYLTLLRGGIPGEEILVRRMLLGLIDRLGFGEHVPPDQLIFFQDPDAPCPAGSRPAGERPASFGLNTNLLGVLEGAGLFGKGCPNLIVHFPGKTLKAQTETLLFQDGTGDWQPALFGEAGAAVCRHEPALRCLERGKLDEECFFDDLVEFNPPPDEAQAHTILLNGCYRDSIEQLLKVMVLKKLLDLNPNLPLTLVGFHPGREIVFPDPAELQEMKHLVDPAAARLYYESLDYYRAFETKLLRALDTPDLKFIEELFARVDFFDEPESPPSPDDPHDAEPPPL